MEEDACDIHRKGICENDLNQGKSQIRFLGAGNPHLEKTDKVRRRGNYEAEPH